MNYLGLLRLPPEELDPAPELFDLPGLEDLGDDSILGELFLKDGSLEGADLSILELLFGSSQDLDLSLWFLVSIDRFLLKDRSESWF